MSVKRKFDLDDDNGVQREYQRAKQLRLDIPQSSMDVDMCDAAPADSSPAASITSLPQSTFMTPTDYPAFDLYPLPGLAMDCDRLPEQSSSTSPITPLDAPATKSVGIMQPVADSAGTGRQHGPACTQIPRLRMSCSAGLYGSRSMWTHCLDCGAIQMVDS